MFVIYQGSNRKFAIVAKLIFFCSLQIRIFSSLLIVHAWKGKKEEYSIEKLIVFSMPHHRVEACYFSKSFGCQLCV